MLSQAEIDALPTILDVVEQISKMENDMLLRNGVTIFPGDAFQGVRADFMINASLLFSVRMLKGICPVRWILPITG